MFSIQKWFAKDDEFLELLEASAQAGNTSVRALKEILHSHKTAHSLEAFAVTRRQDKLITERITHLLARSSIISLDREDIEELANALYKIPKTVEKFAERYSISAAPVAAVDFSAQVALAEQSTDTVILMIKAVAESHFDQVNSFNEKLRSIESEADNLMLQLLAELYSGKYPPLTVVTVKDLRELLERVLERCRDVGNVVANVVLKHS
jgi:uncharacterized protein Yka (UPF0111/DUF47 family)